LSSEHSCVRWLLMAAETLSKLETTRANLSSTSERLQERQQSAEEVLRDMRAVLKRWDDAKARFGEALDGAARRIAEGMQAEGVTAPEGPPSKETAHGVKHADCGWANPRRVVCCDEVARPTMSAQVPAHEYLDEPDVLAAKVRVLADLIRRSRHAALYTGAGLSTAAGIGDYASKAGKASVVLPHKLSKGTPFDAADAIDAKPTYAHRVLSAAYHQGLIKEWVNQNHDGLPQKAGTPHEAVNEIHGGWFDPANPVVPMDGALRAENVRRLNAAVERSDLVLALGTSLSGVSADRIVSTVGIKAVNQQEAGTTPITSGVKHLSVAQSSDTGAPVEVDAEKVAGTWQGGDVLGAVIVNVQQTRLDKIASLRIFAKLDDVMTALAMELALDVRPMVHEATSALEGTHGRLSVWDGLPYNPETGERDHAKTTRLDLSAGRGIRLSDGNAGAGSEAAIPGTKGIVSDRRTAQHHYVLEFEDGKIRVLGQWMIEAACGGRLESLPVLNV